MVEDPIALSERQALAVTCTEFMELGMDGLVDTMDDVVKITAFVTDIERYADYSKARSEAFTNNMPASTAVTSPRLLQDGLLVEIEAIAEIGSG